MIQWTSHKRGVLALGYSPDGAMLVSGGHDHSLCIWDPVSGERRADLRHHSPPIEDLAFSPDGRLLALATSGPAVVLCDRACLQDRRLAGAFTEDIREAGFSSVAFSPDGRNLVSAGTLHGTRSRATLWDVTAFKSGREPRIDALDLRDNGWLTAAYSSDGRTIALGAARGRIVLWPYPIPRESLRRRGQLFDRVAHAWRGRRSSIVEVRAGSRDSVRRIAFSPDGTSLAAAIGNFVDFWEYRHPEEKLPVVSNRRQLRGHVKAVRSLAFAADGRTIATVSLDGTLRIWDARDAFERSCLDAGVGPLHCLALAPDGMTVAVGGEGGDIAIIDLDERP